MALTCLSVNEIRHMHAALCRPAHPPDHYLHWSLGHRHQATARQYHYQRRHHRDH
jgi:hypothetical protein